MADFNISFLFQAIGAFCIAIAFLPQTISALKAKDTSGLSFICYLIYHIGISCIIFYALQKGYYIILIANFFS